MLEPLPPRIDRFLVEKLGGLCRDLPTVAQAMERTLADCEAKGYAVHRVGIWQHHESKVYKGRVVVSDPRYYGAASMWAAASLGVSYA